MATGAPQRRIVVDSREKQPYAFANSLRAALPSGDYSIEGLEDCFAIERKSLADWIHTVLQGRKRFRNELIRLQDYRFAAVVIEATIEDILSGDYRSEITPQALLGITCGVMQAYHPVHVILAGSRPHAYAVVSELLRLGMDRYGK